MENDTITIDLTEPFEPQSIIDHLTYCSYRYNRLRSPEIPYKEWDCIFKNVESLENKFMKEVFGK